MRRDCTPEPFPFSLALWALTITAPTPHPVSTRQDPGTGGDVLCEMCECLTQQLQFGATAGEVGRAFGVATGPVAVTVTSATVVVTEGPAGPGE